MLDLMRFAGFYAAHGIWSVSDGEDLIPFVGSVDEDDNLSLFRMTHENIADGAHAAQQTVDEGEPGWVAGLFVADSRVRLETGKIDALLVEAVEYDTETKVSLAVPYRAVNSSEGFAVYHPKVVNATHQVPTDAEWMEAFFDGVDSHEDAAPVWLAHIASNPSTGELLRLTG